MIHCLNGNCVEWRLFTFLYCHLSLPISILSLSLSLLFVSHSIHQQFINLLFSWSELNVRIHLYLCWPNMVLVILSYAWDGQSVTHNQLYPLHMYLIRKISTHSYRCWIEYLFWAHRICRIEDSIITVFIPTIFEQIL